MISPKLQVYLKDLGIGSTVVDGEIRGKITDGGKAAKFLSSKVGSPQIMSKTKIIINTFKNQEVVV